MVLTGGGSKCGMYPYAALRAPERRAERERFSAVRTLHLELGMLRVQDVATRWPVVVSVSETAAQAHALAEARAVHHLLVTSGRTVVGVVCGCDLADAEAGAPVSKYMQSPFVFVRPEASIEAAAKTMVGHGVGCLPVLDELGQATGVVTRRDLREAGALPSLPELDACASCGTTHGLAKATRCGDVAFCVECLARSQPRQAQRETTLGGSD